MENLISAPVVAKVIPTEVENPRTGEVFQVLLVEQKTLVERPDGSFKLGTVKTRLFTDWSEAECEATIGKVLTGFEIARVDCEEYTYVVDGEEKTFSHTWVLRKVK